VYPTTTAFISAVFRLANEAAKLANGPVTLCDLVLRCGVGPVPLLQNNGTEPAPVTAMGWEHQNLEKGHFQ
jgi:hypothetical protein